MPIYQITPLANNFSALEVAIDIQQIAEGLDAHVLPNKAGWVVAYKGTSVELSNLLGLTGLPKGEASKLGSTLIVSVSAYYGRASSDLWEWLKTRFEAEP